MATPLRGIVEPMIVRVGRHPRSKKGPRSKLNESHLREEGITSRETVVSPDIALALWRRDRLLVHDSLLLAALDALEVRRATGAWPESQAALPKASERLDHSAWPSEPFRFERDGEALIHHSEPEGQLASWRLEPE